MNTEGTKNLVHALLKVQMPLKRFVYLSSLSVFGAIREQQPYQEITEHDTPRPNTAYGKSKLEAERFLDSIGNDFPYIVLRPTGVYGPREKDYFLMVKSIRSHTDFSVGFRRCGASRVSCPRPRHERSQIFPFRRPRVPQQHVQQPDS